MPRTAEGNYQQVTSFARDPAAADKHAFVCTSIDVAVHKTLCLPLEVLRGATAVDVRNMLVT